MIVYFADRQLNIIGQASTHLPEGMVISDDLKTEDVETGVALFECVIPFSSATRGLVDACTKCGNYILRSNDGENEFYTIIEREIDTKKREVYLYAEDAGLDLLNEVCGAYTATVAHPIDYYINKFAYDSGFEIGINEIPSLSRTLSWDGEATATERIASVATQFDNCEISYSFKIKGLSLTNKYINIYKKRGKDVGAQLRLDYEINCIIAKDSIANLATALYPTGGTPEGSETPINLNGYHYDDGDIYLEGAYLKSRTALRKWSRYLNPNEPHTTYTGHILKLYTYDTTEQSTLCAHAVTALKKACEMEVNYEVDVAELPGDIQIGDRVNIVDDAGELYVSSRILKLETSIANDKRTATLGEYLIKGSGISQKIEELSAKFTQLASKRPFYTWVAYADDASGTNISLNPTGKVYMGTAANQVLEAADIADPSVYTWVRVKGDDAVNIYIHSSAGTAFKNDEIDTVLTVTVYHGGVTVTDQPGLIAEFGSGAYLEWSVRKYGDTSFTTILSTDAHLSKAGWVYTVGPQDIDTQAVFNVELIVP